MANIYVASVNGGKVVAGDSKYGFFGEVPASELWSGDELSKLLGITSGVLINSDTPWLKFVIDGKIIFKTKRSIRSNLSWSDLRKGGVIDEGKTIVDKKGNVFEVRLMRGANTNPSLNNLVDRGAIDSEWNRLMLPINEKSVDKKWSHPQNVGVIPDNWDIRYNDQDLSLSYNDKGSCQWCPENIISDQKLRVYRGPDSAGRDSSRIWRENPDISSDMFGWSPVLELISPYKMRYHILKKNNNYGYYKSGKWHSLGDTLPSCDIIKSQGMPSLETLNQGDYDFTHSMTTNAPQKQYSGIINFNDEGLKNIKGIDVKEVELDE